MTHRCIGEGYLIGGFGRLPERTEEYYFAALDRKVTGCNNLVCDDCGATVRQQLGFRLSDPYLEPRPLYDSADWPAAAGLAKSGGMRVYVCHCHVKEMTHSLSLRVDEEDYYDEPFEEGPPPWRCAGHPDLSLPTTLDGIELSVSPDWKAVVKRVVALQKVDAPEPFDTPGHWLLRLSRMLGDDARLALQKAARNSGNKSLAKLFA